MSTEYERPTYDEDAMPCGYTSYESRDGDGVTAGTEPGVEEIEQSQTGGDLPATGAGAEGLERDVWQALYRIEDPEMPVSIVDLGLVYGVDVDPDAGSVDVEMTLTYTGCPAREMLIGSVREAVTAVEGIEECTVRLVWSPPWSVEMVTAYGKNALQEFGLSV
jgi:metal-sulfur cluster biosynthetic enzyme